MAIRPYSTICKWFDREEIDKINPLKANWVILKPRQRVGRRPMTARKQENVVG